MNTYSASIGKPKKGKTHQISLHHTMIGPRAKCGKLSDLLLAHYPLILNQEEVEAMRHDWARNGYLRQEKNIIFEVSVIAMQQVIAEWRGLPEFEGWVYTSTGKDLDDERDRRKMEFRRLVEKQYVRANRLIRHAESLWVQRFGLQKGLSTFQRSSCNVGQ